MNGNRLSLRGLDGANPLGFLASLGVLRILSADPERDRVAMGWNIDEGMWNPSIHGIPHDRDGLANLIATRINCPFSPNEHAEYEREKAQKSYQEKRTELKRQEDALKKIADKNARMEVERRELEPLRRELDGLKGSWLSALSASLPPTSAELAIGRHIDCAPDRYRELALDAMAESRRENRETADLYAAFGSDAVAEDEKMQTTRFCFITGSGGQYFLETIRQLIQRVDAGRIRRALFERAEPQDESCSMRWDPREDRRYALMWEDPGTKSKPKSQWALNLLAYHGLKLLPSVPRAEGLRAVGWSNVGQAAWKWPIWAAPVSVEIVRSILSHPSVISQNKRELKQIGVPCVFESERIQVGSPPLCKINFAPAKRLA